MVLLILAALARGIVSAMKSAVSDCYHGQDAAGKVPVVVGIHTAAWQKPSSRCGKQGAGRHRGPRQYYVMRMPGRNGFELDIP